MSTIIENSNFVLNLDPIDIVVREGLDRYRRVKRIYLYARTNSANSYY